MTDIAVLATSLSQARIEYNIHAQAGTVIEETGASDMRDMAPVMRELMRWLSCRADGSLANRMVRKTSGTQLRQEPTVTP